MKQIVALFLLLCLAIFSHAQDSGQLVFSGKIITDDTSETLPFTNIIKGSSGTTSNIYGEFSVLVNPGDSLLFSYLGYQKKLIVIPTTQRVDMKDKEVMLLRDITYLKPVIISNIPENLEDFKEVIMETHLPDSVDLINARKSLSLSTYQYLYMRSYKLTMTDYDNYAMFLKGNEGLNPAGGNIKGLFKFLKNRAKGVPLEGTYEHYKYYEKTKKQ